MPGVAVRIVVNKLVVPPAPTNCRGKTWFRNELKCGGVPCSRFPEYIHEATSLKNEEYKIVEILLNLGFP